MAFSKWKNWIPASKISGRIEQASEIFQERAAIREFDGEQSRVEAELGALEETLPYLQDGKFLVIPNNSPKKYHWWNGGQSIESTLRELGAFEETIKKYVANWAVEGGPCDE